jgi:hypothetical protein
VTTTRHGEPRLAAAASWLVLAASFGMSAATWIALATLAGFTGTIAGLIPLAWLMPAVVDGYVVVALVLWMSPVPARVAHHARVHTYAAGSVGIAAQSAYHCLTVLTATGTVWRAVLAASVGAMPPAAAAFSVHMRAMGRRESRAVEPVAETTPAPAPAPAVLPAPIAEAPQVTAPEVPVALPAPAPEPAPEPASDEDPPAKVKRPAAASAPRRPFVVTQRAAAAMQSDGMDVAQIAEALGVSPRQVRNALRPVPVGAEQ